MMRRCASLFLVLCLALILASTACRTSVTVPNGPSFKGRLIVYTERPYETNRVYQIKNDPGTGKANLEVIADEVEDFALSPDGSHLIYTVRMHSGIFLRDIRSAEVRKLDVSGGASALNWSPDGKQFCYVDNNSHELVVSNLSGQSQVVDKAASEKYGKFGVIAQNTLPNYGAIESPFWVGPNLMVFQRFTGPFPDEVSARASDNFPPTTTTLAALVGKTRLVDAPRRWYVGSQCSSFVVFGKESTGRVFGRHSDKVRAAAPFYIAHDFRDFEKTELRPLPVTRSDVDCYSCDEPLKFIAETCQLYYVKSEPAPRSPSGPRQNTIFFLDPISLQSQPGTDLGKDRTLFDTLSSSDGKIIALAFNDSHYHSISIKDLKTGAETYLVKVFPPPPGKTDVVTEEYFNVIKFLGWLPE